MSKEDDFKVLKIPTCVLKVNIHCDGCKQKVKRLLQKIEGVFTISITAENGRVTVTGNVDPETIIKKLLKAGKHAELISPKSANNQQLNNQFQNLLIDSNKCIKDVNSQKGKNDQKKNPPPQQQLQQQMKMFKDLKLSQLKNLKLPFKNQKSVKFDVPDEGDFSDDDGFSDELCEDDDYDDDFEEDFDDDPRKPINGHGMGNNQQSAMKMNIVNDKKAHGNGKKGGEIPVPNKPIDSKNGVKRGGTLPPAKIAGKDGNGTPNNKCPGNGGGAGNKIHVINNSNTKKNGRIDMCNDFQNFTAIKGACGPQMGSMQMGHTPAVQGLPAMNTAPYMHGVPPPEMIAAFPGGNPQYQQYLQMMMNQQRQNERFPHLMYGQQPPPQVTYYPQPMPTAPYAHFFSDENANSCSIM